MKVCIINLGMHLAHCTLELPTSIALNAMLSLLVSFHTRKLGIATWMTLIQNVQNLLDIITGKLALINHPEKRPSKNRKTKRT